MLYHMYRTGRVHHASQLTGVNVVGCALWLEGLNCQRLMHVALIMALALELPNVLKACPSPLQQEGPDSQSQR